MTIKDNKPISTRLRVTLQPLYKLPPLFLDAYGRFAAQSMVRIASW